MKTNLGEPPEKVVLASESPRRKEMLRALQVPFEVFVPRVEETWDDRKNARKVATELAVLKARKWKASRKALVIAMDTIVVVNGRKLGKPANEEEAKRMLRSLSGKMHQVITGVALMWNGQTVQDAAVTDVAFRRIRPAEIDWYVRSGEPFDKAGAYAIQGRGRIFIDRIDGCYYNVVGFPLALFQRLLDRFGLRVLDLTKGHGCV